MKKYVVLLLALTLVLSVALVACEVNEENTTEVKTEAPTEEATTEEETTEEETTGNATEDVFEGLAVMSYEEYIAAELDAPVKIQAYVQATQSWWNDQIVVYLQDEDGGYLAYNMACSEEDAAKLVPGVKIEITGYKAEYAGLVEIADGEFTFVEGAESFIAEAADLTSILANEEELIKHQNEYAVFTGLTIEKIEYKNGEPGDDIYVTVKQGEESFSFCVERYLTDPDTDVYKAFAELEVGDIVNITGFVYWYNGVNTHITSVLSAMTHEEYIAAEMDTPVMIEAYVQATQSWWNNQIVVYLQDEDGGYLAYNMACSEEDAAKLVTGVKINVYGYKGAYAGEVEIVDGAFTFVDGADTYVAQPADLTSVLANETELIKHQNEYAVFKGLTIEKIEYKNGEPGDDIYVTVKLGEDSFSFCVERYLTDPDTDVYKAFATLNAGDVVDITGFVYWYNGINTHITAVTAATAAN